MFSKTCEYAVRAMIYIAARGSEGRKVGISELCAAIGAPAYFTAKILQELGRHRLICSRKGLHGGFYLDAIQSGRRLIDVVKAIDGDRLFTGCGLGLKTCSEENPCPLHHQFLKIRQDLKHMLEEKTIATMAQSLETGAGFLKSN